VRKVQRARVPDGPGRGPGRGGGAEPERVGATAQVPSAGRNGRRERGDVRGVRPARLSGGRRRAGEQRGHRVQDGRHGTVRGTSGRDGARQLFRAAGRVRRAVPVIAARRPRCERVQLGRPPDPYTRHPVEGAAVLAAVDRPTAGRVDAAVRGCGPRRRTRTARLAVVRLRRVQGGR